MSIVSRVAGAAMLLAGLILLPANGRAAEPSYDDYVTQLKAGKLDIDYTALRLAYAASPKYAPYGSSMVLAKTMTKAYGAGDCGAAMMHAQEIFEANFVSIDAHMVASLCHKKAGNEEGAQRAYMIVRGLVRSVLKSGDGKSPETAFVVISIDEEYKALEALSLMPGTQSLVSHGGSSFDRLDARKRDSGEPVTLYFNVDRPHAQLMQTLQQKKP